MVCIRSMFRRILFIRYFYVWGFGFSEGVSHCRRFHRVAVGFIVLSSTSSSVFVLAWQAGVALLRHVRQDLQDRGLSGRHHALWAGAGGRRQCRPRQRRWVRNPYYHSFPTEINLHKISAEPFSLNPHNSTRVCYSATKPAFRLFCRMLHFSNISRVLDFSLPNVSSNPTMLALCNMYDRIPTPVTPPVFWFSTAPQIPDSLRSIFHTYPLYGRNIQRAVKDTCTTICTLT